MKGPSPCPLPKAREGGFIILNQGTALSPRQAVPPAPPILRLFPGFYAGNDGAWGQIKHPQKMFFGNTVAAELSQDAAYEKVCEAFGGYGERVEKPEDIRPALERAFAFANRENKPACLNVIIDRNAPYGRSSVIGL